MRLCYRTVEGYSSVGGGFDGLAILRALGNFFMVFFGAFAMGAAMGCITALVSLREFPLRATQLSVYISVNTKLVEIWQHCKVL
jgi:sodium/hydrogen exchanger-like protein 6/7